MSSESLLPIGRTIAHVEKADLEKYATHSVAEIQGTHFKVRQANYTKQKKKAHSGDSVMELHAVDVFETKRKCLHIMQYLEMPGDLPDHSMAGLNFYVPNLLVINFMLPTYEPSNPLWGKAVYDGPGMSFVVYLKVPADTLEEMKSESTAVATLLRKWFQLDPTSQSDYELRGRLKCIPILCNPEEVKLGMAFSSLVKSYNAKPFLTGPKYHSFVKNDRYIEVDVDIHNYVFPARKTFVGLVPEIPKMRLDIGVVIEAREEDEFPEQMLTGFHLLHLDPSRATKLMVSDCAPVEQEVVDS